MDGMIHCSLLLASLLLLLLLDPPLEGGGLLGGGGLHGHVGRGRDVLQRDRGRRLRLAPGLLRLLDGQDGLLHHGVPVLPDVGVPGLALLALAVGRGDLPGAVRVVHVAVDGPLVNNWLSRGRLEVR